MSGQKEAALIYGRRMAPVISRGFHVAINAALEKWGMTAPNPSVGCVLLDEQGAILSVGAHPRAGGPHAEVVAFEAAQKSGLLERVRHALVTLEPCAHYGRTPPCSLLLAQSPVSHIWIGARDPNSDAAGGGSVLRHAGKQVFFLEEDSGISSLYTEIIRDCRALLAPFASSVLRGRPWVTVKQALDHTGSMCPPAGQKTFTSSESLHFAHCLRRATDALVTGSGTVRADEPSFTVRHIADHEGRKSLSFPRLLVLCSRENILPERWIQAREQDGFSVVPCRSLSELPDILKRHHSLWAMVEAGPTLLEALKEAGLWDDWLTIRQGALQAGCNREDLMSFSLNPDLEQQWRESPAALLQRYYHQSHRNSLTDQVVAASKGKEERAQICFQVL